MPPSLPRKTRPGVAGLPSSVDAVPVHAVLVGRCRRADRRPTAVTWPPSVDVRRLTSALKMWFWSSGSTQIAAEPPLVAAVAWYGAARRRAKRVAAVVGAVEALVRAGRCRRRRRRCGSGCSARRRRRSGRGSGPTSGRSGPVVGRQRVDDVLQALPRVAAVLGAEQAGADAAVDARPLLRVWSHSDA